ncbi:MAG TPA: hypothetical protein VMU74_03745 [Gaiellaceae bacterium]|nr:hypothetical protein [Gaiellaceae bacterium]
MLELREHRQHLQHHPSSSRTGVERLRRRLENNIECVEFLGELCELAHLPRESVDAVDE